MSEEINKLDPEFKYKIAEIPGGDSVKACYSCGVCTASCPVNEVHEEFNPRKLIRMILLGDKEGILGTDIIWYCLLCERCFANCPQKVNFAHITRALRKIAIDEGHSSEVLEDNIKQINSFIASVREKLITEVLKDKKSLEGNDIKKKLNELYTSVLKS